MVAVAPSEATITAAMPASCQMVSVSRKIRKPDSAPSAGWPLIRMPKSREGIWGRATMSSA
ncbi:hypothetical protein D3C72_2487320 [compost metagenome]